MIWSKSKRALKLLLADSVRDHVEYHMTRYGPGLSSIMTRAWVTWDGKEIAHMSTVEVLMEAYQQQQRADPAGEMVDQRPGLLSRYAFEKAVEFYLEAPIERSFTSDNPIVKALAMFDRRLGKRRLQALNIGETDHPMVKQFYRLRLQAEDLPAADPTP